MSLQYIIDGYNLINHSQFSQTLKQNKDAKASLLTFIKGKRLTGSSKNKITVVFDGYPSSKESCDDNSGVCVLFSRKISADEKIKKIVEESGQRKNMVVVSDDKEIIFFVKSLGAKTLSVEDFINRGKNSTYAKNKKLLKPELTYSQMHQINQELSKLWLK